MDEWLVETEAAMVRAMGYRERPERPAPNVAAFRAADRVRLAAARLGFAPDGVGPDIEGGIYLVFVGGHSGSELARPTAWVTCTCDNDGDIVVLFDRTDGPTTAEQVTAEQLLEVMAGVRQYLHGEGEIASPDGEDWRGVEEEAEAHLFPTWAPVAARARLPGLMALLRRAVAHGVAHGGSDPESEFEELSRTHIGVLRQNGAARELIYQALQKAGHGRPRHPRWVHVKAIFGLGSTSASKLCRQYDLDPEEMVGRLEDDDDE